MKKENMTREYWNSRAAGFRKNHISAYEEEFLKRAELLEGETVFDMGCGSGTLAIPLAEKGHRVLACDFSEEMIRLLREEAEKRGIRKLIDARVLDWNENWEERNLPLCDVAIASRSFITEDPESAIEKLSSMAVRKVILTAPTREGARCCLEAAEHIGIEPEDRYMDILKVLDDKNLSYTYEFMDLGEKKTEFKDIDDCYMRVRNGFEELSTAQEEKLKSFLEERYIDGRLRVKWPVKWAYIWWEK